MERFRWVVCRLPRRDEGPNKKRMSTRIFNITYLSAVPLLALVLAISIACARTMGPAALTGELTGELVFARSLVAENEKYLETKTLPQEGFIALVDITGLNLSLHLPSYVSEPHLIAYGEIDSETSRRLPVPFTIRYEPSNIDLESKYAIFVLYTESTGQGLTSQGAHYTNLYGFRTAPTRVFTDGYPRHDVIVRIDLIEWIS